MSNYTPGKWFADQYGHVYGWTASAGVAESVVLLDGRHSQATRKDKNLIAAAPDLLAALRALCDICEDDDQYPEHTEAARAAIAEAIGE